MSDNILSEGTAAADITVKLPHGLHSRPSAKLSQLARSYKADIRLITSGGDADAKSMLDILSLAIPCNGPVRIFAEGPDAAEAVAQITAILTDPESWPAQ